MKKSLFQLVIIFCCCLSVNILAQDLIADKGSFRVDVKNKIIVWHVADLDSLKSTNKKFSKIIFNQNFTIENGTIENLSYNKTTVVSNGSIFKLYITKLPLIHIALDTNAINSKEKIAGYFTYFNDKELIETEMGVRHRGNLSLSFSKKSFDLEFWEDSINKQEKDVKFKGQRSDGDWILDAMFNEPLRLRSFVAANLWTTIHQPYYLNKEPKAESGFGVKYVEVFQNNEYYGVYQLSESVDRKQLKLKKNKERDIYGELFKANTYEGGPSFIKSPKKYIYILTTWNGWELKYPIIDDEAEWKNLSEFTSLVVHGSDEDFLKNIESKIEISNAIDYYLFVNLLGATDNLGKNYYLARYTKNEPYFFIPWDLDGVWGVIQDGKEQYNTTKVLDNGLLKRLIDLNPNGYLEKVKKRWKNLRSNEFSNEKLFSKINKIYNQFTDEKIYEREQLVWQNKLSEKSNEAHYQHLKWWLEKKLTYLDDQFSKM